MRSGPRDYVRLDAKGRPVKAYAGDGSLNLKVTAAAAAADAATGRLALLATSPNDPGHFEVRLYNFKAKLERTIDGTSVTAIAFDHAGRLLVVRSLTASEDNGAGNTIDVRRQRVSRYDARTGAIDISFGTAGTAPLTPAGDVAALRVAADDGVLLVTRTPEGETGVFGRTMYVAPLDAAGRAVADFGAGGVVTAAIGSHNESSNHTVDANTFLDGAYVAADGSVAVFGRYAYSNTDDETGLTTGSLFRPQVQAFDADGTARPIVDLSAASASMRHLRDRRRPAVGTGVQRF